MRFEDKIEWLMRDRGLNQETLANALELSQSTVSRWLNGGKPHRRIALNIAIFFNIDVDSLLDDALDLPPGFMPPVPAHSPPGSGAENATSKNIKISEMGVEKGIDREELRRTIDEMKRLVGDLERIYKRK
jgi:transcriptional regulator with XRE-family HTH domain